MTIRAGANAAMSIGIGRGRAPILVDRARLGLLRGGPSDSGTLRTDPGAADVACRLRRDLALLGGQTDPPRLRFGFRSGADVIVEPDGNRSGHEGASAGGCSISNVHGYYVPVAMLRHWTFVTGFPHLFTADFKLLSGGSSTRQRPRADEVTSLSYGGRRYCGSQGTGTKNRPPTVFSALFSLVDAASRNAISNRPATV